MSALLKEKKLVDKIDAKTAAAHYHKDWLSNRPMQQ